MKGVTVTAKEWVVVVVVDDVSGELCGEGEMEVEGEVVGGTLLEMGETVKVLGATRVVGQLEVDVDAVYSYFGEGKVGQPVEKEVADGVGPAVAPAAVAPAAAGPAEGQERGGGEPRDGAQEPDGPALEGEGEDALAEDTAGLLTVADDLNHPEGFEILDADRGSTEGREREQLPVEDDGLGAGEKGE